MRSNASRYTDQFQKDAVALVSKGERSLALVAADLGINHWTLRDWCRREAMASRSKKKGKGRFTNATSTPSKMTGSTSPPEEESLEEKLARQDRYIAQLERDIESLEQDKAILKKAAAFFARESE